MKKIFITITVITCVNILISCTKEVRPQPVTSVEHNTALFKKDIGTAD